MDTPDDPGAVFDLLLASSATRARSPGSGRSWRASPLPLRKTPRPVFLPGKRREVADIDPAVRAVFRELATGRREWPLYLHGPPGTGKTCAALALLDHLAEWQQQYVTATELTARVMDTFGTRERFDWRPFGPYREQNPAPYPAGKAGAVLVVLDEIGTRANVTDTHYECVQRVIDMREGCPLVLVGNLDPGQLAAVYDGRIASRCVAGTVVRLGGPDRRLAGS